MTIPMKPINQWTDEELREYEKTGLIPASAQVREQTSLSRVQEDPLAGMSYEQLAARLAEIEKDKPKGALEGVKQSFTTIPQNVKAVGEAIVDDPLRVLGATAKGIFGMLTEREQQQELVKGFVGDIWSVTGGLVQTATDAYLDNFLGKDRPGYNNFLDKVFPKYDDLEAGQRAARTTNVAAGFLLGGIVGKALRKIPTKAVAKELSIAGKELNAPALPKNASVDQIMEYALTIAPEDAINASKLLKDAGVKTLGKRAAIEGVTGGLTAAAMDVNLRYSDDPGRDALTYAIAGTMIGGLAEFGGAGIDMVRGKPQTTKVLRDAMVMSVVPNLGKILTAEGAASFTSAVLLDNADALDALITYMDPKGELRLDLPEGFDASDIIKKNKENATIHTAEDGKQTLFVFGKDLFDENNTAQSLTEHALWRSGQKMTRQVLHDLIDKGQKHYVPDALNRSADDRPLRVYHGSGTALDVDLEPRPVLGGTAIYFSVAAPFTENFSIWGGESRTVKREQSAPNTYAYELATTADKILSVPSAMSDMGYNNGSASFGSVQPFIDADVAKRMQEAAVRLVDRVFTWKDGRDPELPAHSTMDPITSYQFKLGYYPRVVQAFTKYLNFLQDPKNSVDWAGTIPLEGIADVAKEAGFDAVMFADVRGASLSASINLAQISPRMQISYLADIARELILLKEKQGVKVTDLPENPKTGAPYTLDEIEAMRSQFLDQKIQSNVVKGPRPVSLGEYKSAFLAKANEMYDQYTAQFGFGSNLDTQQVMQIQALLKDLSDMPSWAGDLVNLDQVTQYGPTAFLYKALKKSLNPDQLNQLQAILEKGYEATGMKAASAVPDFATTFPTKATDLLYKSTLQSNFDSDQMKMFDVLVKRLVADKWDGKMTTLYHLAEFDDLTSTITSEQMARLDRLLYDAYASATSPVNSNAPAVMMAKVLSPEGIKRIYDKALGEVEVTKLVTGDNPTYLADVAESITPIVMSIIDHAAQSEMWGPASIDMDTYAELKTMIGADVADQLIADIHAHHLTADWSNVPQPKPVTEKSMSSHAARLFRDWITANTTDAERLRLSNRSEFAVVNPKILVRPWESTRARKIWAKRHLKQLAKDGYYEGMGVLVDGEEMVFSHLTKGGKARVYDPATGAGKLVDRNKIVRPVGAEAAVFQLNPEEYTAPDGSVKKRIGVETTEVMVTAAQNWKEFKDLLDPAQRQLVEISEQIRTIEFEGEKLDLIANLTTNGYYPLIQTDGTVVLKSISDPAFSKITGKGIEGLREAGKTLDLPTHQDEIIAKLQQDLGVPVILAKNGAKDWKGSGIERGLRSRLALKMATVAYKATPLSAVVDDLDTKYGTSIAPEMNKLKSIILTENAAAEPFRQAANSLMERLSKIKPEESALFKAFVEATDWGEWVQRGMYGKKPTVTELAFTETLLGEGKITTADRQKANKFVTRLFAMKDKLDPNNLPAVQKLMQELKDKYEINTPEIESAVKTLIDIRENYKPQDVNIYNVLRGAELKQDGSASRAKMIADNNLSPEFLKIVEGYDKLMKELAIRFDIDPNTRIANYFPHISKYNDFAISELDLSRDVGIDKSLRPFASELARTGYYIDSELISDPGDALARYINAGFRSKYRAPAIKRLGETIETSANQFSGDKRLQDGFRRSFEHIKDAAMNYDSVEEYLMKNSAEKYMERLSGNKTVSREYIKAFMRYMEFKVQGYKPVAGLRDGTSFMLFYGMQFGPKRMIEMMKLLPEAIRQGEMLAKSGLIPSLEATSISEPITAVRGLSQGLIDKGLAGLSKIEEAGFKGSLQPQVYRMAHAVAYIETTKWVGKHMSDFASGKISKDALIEAIDLKMYDDSVIKTFDELMAKEDYKGAIDELAKRSGGMTVGEYSKMNAALMFDNRFAKVMFQFTQWPLWALNQTSKIMSRSSKKSAATKIAFIVGSSYLSKEVAEETGFNFNTWMFNPIAWFPEGSPLYSTLVDTKNAVGQGGGISSAAWATAKRQTAFILNPLPLAVTNTVEAALRYDEGQPLEAVLFRAFGGQLNTDVFSRPSLWDELTR